jgi:hypothetical protein
MVGQYGTGDATYPDLPHFFLAHVIHWGVEMQVLQSIQRQ